MKVKFEHLEEIYTDPEAAPGQLVGLCFCTPIGIDTRVYEVWTDLSQSFVIGEYDVTEKQRRAIVRAANEIIDSMTPEELRERYAPHLICTDLQAWAAIRITIEVCTND